MHPKGGAGLGRQHAFRNGAFKSGFILVEGCAGTIGQAFHSFGQNADPSVGGWVLGPRSLEYSSMDKKNHQKRGKLKVRLKIWYIWPRQNPVVGCFGFDLGHLVMMEFCPGWEVVPR